MIRIYCPACGHRYKIDLDRCGKKVRCKCGEVFRAPLAAEIVEPPPQHAALESPDIFPPITEPPLQSSALGAPDISSTAAPPLFGSPAIGGGPTTHNASTPSHAEEPWETPFQRWLKSLQIQRNYALTCGGTLIMVGLVALILPFFGLQLARLQRAGASPHEIRIMATVSVAVGAIVAFFSQWKALAAGAAMAMASLAALGVIWLLPDPNAPPPGNAFIANAPVMQQAPIAVRHIQPQVRQLPTDGSKHELRPVHPAAVAEPKTDNFARTELAGGAGGNKYATVDPAMRPLIGLRYRLERLDGRQAIMEVVPLYERRQDDETSADRIIASDGYVIGGLEVAADNYVRAARVIFVRYDGKRIHPEDNYASEWIGEPTDRAKKTLDGGGRLVLGVYGGKGMVLDSVGLLLRKD